MTRAVVMGAGSTSSFGAGGLGNIKSGGGLGPGRGLGLGIGTFVGSAHCANLPSSALHATEPSFWAAWQARLLDEKKGAKHSSALMPNDWHSLPLLFTSCAQVAMQSRPESSAPHLTLKPLQ